MLTWHKIGDKSSPLQHEDKFCPRQTIDTLIRKKRILNDFPFDTVKKAREKLNAFEIRKGPFDLCFRDALEIST